MTKDVIILRSEERVQREVATLRRNNFNPYFVLDRVELILKIKEMPNAFLVALFCDGEEYLEETRSIMNELKAMEEMKSKSIFVIFKNADLIFAEDFRSQDDFIITPYYDKIAIKRISNLYELQKRDRIQKEEIDELFIMTETLTKLIATVFHLIIPSAEENSEKVGRYTTYIGELYQKEYPNKLSERDVNILSNLVLLHDIGLIYINRNVLDNKGGSEYEDQLEFRKHPLIGGQLFRMVRQSIYEKYGRNTSFIERAIETTEYHHELGDGSGYPFGLYCDSIPLFARIIIIGEYLSNNINSTEDVIPTVTELIDNVNENPKYDQEIVQLINKNISGFLNLATLDYE